MDTTTPKATDEGLIRTVEATNEQAFDPTFFDGGHIVAAGVRTADGTVYDGVSLPTAVGRASLCAEPVALGAAIADGYEPTQLQTCVAVSYPHPDHDADEQRVIPPCGVCREMLVDYNPDMRVVVPAHAVAGTRQSAENPQETGTEVTDTLSVVSADALLPCRTW